jgi:hypothetical protein
MKTAEKQVHELINNVLPPRMTAVEFIISMCEGKEHTPFSQTTPSGTLSHASPPSDVVETMAAALEGESPPASVPLLTMDHMDTDHIPLVRKLDADWI